MTSPITPDRLRSLFRPRGVALVGASDKSHFSHAAFGNLVSFGHGERTHLVNRRGVEVHGRPTVTSCTEIEGPVDVAFLMVPQAGTLAAMSDAAEAGIRNAVILSSGYGEAGAEGRAAEAELVAHAQKLGMLVLGPNHLGFANFIDRTPVTPVTGLPERAGRIALLSQSGASSSAMLDFATMSGNDLSYLVTLGNEVMITAGHVLDFLVDDESTDAVAIFMESVREPDIFRRAALRATEAGKAVVVLKAGSSELSARTAAAHTGALVGDDKTIDAVFRQCGVIRVDSIEDMMITAGLAAHTGPLAASGIGVVSISGGACDIVADRAEEAGMELPALSPDTEQALKAIMPVYGTVQNPLDVTGAAILDPSLFTKAVTAMSDDSAIGAVAVVSGVPAFGEGPWNGQVFANAIGAGVAQAAVPTVLVSQVMQPVTDYTRGCLEEAGLSYVVPGLKQAVTALSGIARWSQVHHTLNSARGSAAARELPVPTPELRTGTWSEHAARQLLRNAGIPVVPGTLVSSADEAIEAALGFDAPVAMKIVSPDILHKSDVGGVRLDVSGADAVREAYEQVSAGAAKVPGARVEGVLVSPMRSGGTELLIGVVRDPQWGPMLALALGGIFVEVLKDSALSPLPVTAEAAREMLLGLRGAALLQGARGSEPADIDMIAQVVATVGDLALALGDDLESLEINPVRVAGSTVEALDALVTWRTA
ncbi:acetate--CoA ligase family protein [Streptomyces capitiformicae]|uniref:Acetyl-CoA synthetase n=1 Tax=Streptomyces capitiformicae TaxID=2014920 RepID=A0A919DEU8_9ACTN|nr:acetate--CoA ligase family protein [Streptomyces capitiformicae]GHE41665.1 acetyl-CoA synthetase [Streptomyces capitiformicae]